LDAHHHGDSGLPYRPKRSHAIDPHKPPRPGFRGWTIKLNHKVIDLVFFGPTMDPDEIRDSLINHDNYHPNISVELA
jgi:hypothetical protein